MSVELTLTKVRTIIQENTEIFVEEISKLEAGFDFVNFLINDEWVFRFPNSANELAGLINEKRVLENLSSPAPTPVIKHWISKPIGYALPIAGYKFIPGESLESLNCDSCDRLLLAKELGCILQYIHEPCNNQEDLARTLNDAWIGETEKLVALDVFGLQSEQSSTITQFLRQYCPAERTPTCMRIHGDLSAEHIITSNRCHVSGIIDWSNSGCGNRFKDFVGLWGWGGDRFVLEVLANYDACPCEEDWGYIRANGLAYCLHRLRFAEANDLVQKQILRNRLDRRVTEIRRASPTERP